MIGERAPDVTLLLGTEKARIGCWTMWWKSCSTKALWVSSLAARISANCRAPENFADSPDGAS